GWGGVVGRGEGEGDGGRVGRRLAGRGHRADRGDPAADRGAVGQRDRGGGAAPGQPLQRHVQGDLHHPAGAGVGEGRPGRRVAEVGGQRGDPQLAGGQHHLGRGEHAGRGEPVVVLPGPHPGGGRRGVVLVHGPPAAAQRA